MDFKYNGIILSKRDIGETDRIYVIYTKEAGKIKLKAIGVRKPNAKLAGSLEPGTQAEIFMARGKGRGNMTGAIAIENYVSMKSDLESLEKVFYAFGVLEKILPDEEKDEKIFSLLSDYLAAMEKISPIETEGFQREMISFSFLFNFLEAAGYKIQIDRCVKCQEKLVSGENYFSPGLGGIVCSSCRQKENSLFRVGDGPIKLIRLFLKNKVANSSKIKASKKDVSELKLIFSKTLEWIG